jgi:hypothetical protein
MTSKGICSHLLQNTILHRRALSTLVQRALSTFIRLATILSPLKPPDTPLSLAFLRQLPCVGGIGRNNKCKKCTHLDVYHVYQSCKNVENESEIVIVGDASLQKHTECSLM